MLGKYTGFLYGIVSVIVMIALLKLMTRMLRRYTRKRAFKEENEKAFIRYWQYGYVFVSTAICVTAFSGEIHALGITMSFIGSIMAWMLSAPIKNMAGWLFLVISKPFEVGDRIIMGGVTGDVIDITMNHIILNQVGGTTIGEDKSGRGVMLPTQWLFDQVINNYSLELPSDSAGKKYLLDEVIVRITYESDWDEAERILMEVATELTAKAIEETGEKPYIRAEFFPSGVNMRIRYMVAPTDRQRTWSEIVKRIAARLDRNEKVSYAFNKSNVFVNYREGDAYPPQHPEVLSGGEKWTQ